MAIPGMEDYPIKLGTLLFTMVEPEKGREVEYNRWYEHDHFYSGCMVGAVAVRRRPVRRHQAAEGAALPRGQRHDRRQPGRFVPRVYWVLDGKHDEWNEWAVEQVNWLHENGRMFEQRTHIHTLLYEKRWAERKADDTCTIELALDHDYPGLVVVAGDVNDGHTHDEVDAWFRDTYLPGTFRAPWGPDVVLDATTLPLLDDRPADVPPPAAGPNRFLQLHFLDHDPEEGWADGYAKIGQAIDDSGLATHVWTGPFIQTDFGTDKYTDELW